MRTCLLAVALLMALGVPSAHAISAPDAIAAKRSEPAVYLVRLDDAPLASFRGAAKAVDAAGKRLAPTDPSLRGARKLDIGKPESKAYLGYLDRRHGDFLNAAGKRLGRALVPTFRYQVVSNGMALRLDAEEAAALRELPGVLAVEREVIRRPMTDAGPQWIGADAVWNGVVPGSNVRTKGEGTVIGVIDSGINFSHPSFADVGADGYNHTNQRGAFLGICAQTVGRCNDKLIGIYDFTTEGSRIGDDTTGHGSHVASTAGGNVTDSVVVTGTGNIPLRVSGVAPHANLIMYKACVSGEDASCPSSATLAALERAIVDQVDVINYSIGGGPSDPWSGLRNSSMDDGEAFLNARFAGAVGVVAAGNDGPGAGTVSNPGNAPWVIAAANASHSRKFANRADNVTGFGIATPRSFEGQSLTGQVASGRIVNAADFGFPLCSKGDAIDFPPAGASNPWPAGTFQGEIVVCLRGITGRVTKGFNVKAAGASGMILYNDPDNGESVVADDHSLPATHIGNVAGNELVALLAAARAANGELSGTITASRAVLGTQGNVLAGSSGRGPAAPFGGWLKPDIAAPGTNILAAAQFGNGLAAMSGTSMATPHIAGAAALLASANPGWTVAQIESALLTTALDDVLLPDAQTRATAHDAGAGRTFLPGAVRAGLSFNVTREEFVSADPNAINANPLLRDPTRLNMPYLVSERCLQRCTFTRTVTAMVDAAWRVVLPTDTRMRVSVDTENFSLTRGQSKALVFTVDVGDPLLVGKWSFARIGLVDAGINPVASDTQIPIAVFSSAGTLPDELRIAAETTHGFRDVQLSGLVALSNPRFETGELAPYQGQSQGLPEDPTPDDPYDLPSAGVFVKILDLPGELELASSNGVGVIAEVGSSTARDIDLFVGVDTDGDGTPEAGEERCKSTSSGASERCVLTLNAAELADVWILVQNFNASQVAGDIVSLQSAAASLGPGTGVPRFAVTGPGSTTAQQSFPVRVAWSEPRMLAGETWVGFTGFNLGAGAIAQVPVLIQRTASGVSPIVMQGGSDSERLALGPGIAHDRIVVDVPPNATAMTVQTQGSGEVDLYVARATTPSSGPDVGVAPPRGEAQATAIHPGATEKVDLAGAALTPGRWFLTPVNSGSNDARFTLSVEVSAAGAAPPLSDNGYFNPARSGHGSFFHQIGDLWGVIWYTFLQDGSPVWYIATGPKPGGDDATWSAPLLRFTWNGSVNSSTPVGEIVLTATAPDRFVFSWLLDGTFGSEPFQPTGVLGCPQVAGGPLSVSGSWYAPQLSGYGFNIVASPQVEAMTAYVFDASGNPRWVLGSNAPFGSSTFSLTQYAGFCPLCASAPTQGTGVGSLVRNYTTASTGTASVNLSFAPPVAGAWISNHSIEKLSTTLACPAPME